MESTLAQRPRLNADIVALLVVTIWGASFAFQKVALAQLGPSAFMCARYLGMLALSWAVLHLSSAPDAGSDRHPSR